MPASELMELVQQGDLDAFEMRCLEALEGSQVRLADLATAFEQLERLNRPERTATLGQMILENADPKTDPAAGLAIACATLAADAKNADLRKLVIELYKTVHRNAPGFESLLEASGLTGDRPARTALRVLNVCLNISPGATLISRTEDVAVEVTDIDAKNGLFTLRRGGRSTTITADELTREYEPIDSNDFRVLRQLWPERLKELIENDPVAAVIGLIHAHGDAIDQDLLKHELVPRYLEVKAWSKWWTRARGLLKRSPHISIEGRAPVRIVHSAEARTLEDEAWENLSDRGDPEQWLAVIDAYLRDKRQYRQKPDLAFIERLEKRLLEQARLVQPKRPAEALAFALLIEKLRKQTDVALDEATALAADLLRNAADPADLIAKLPESAAALWELALAALTAARPDDGAARAAALMPLAPSTQLDALVGLARTGELLSVVQTHLDTALAEPVANPELIHWLWKGPKDADGLTLPSDDELFVNIIRTFSALGRTLHADAKTTKTFRQRIKAALALREYERADACIRRIDAHRAVTVRGQLERLEGLGNRACDHMLRVLREAHPQLWHVAAEPPKPWEDADVLWSTRAGLSRKESEREQLINVTMHENGKRIGEAASHGDLSENSEYRFALEERDLLRARLAQMNQELSLARVLEPHNVPADHVGVGTRVTLRGVEGSETRVMTFLGPFDSDVDNGIFNYLAPISVKLMGLHVGERAALTIDGKESEFEVIQIADGLDSP